MGTVRDLDGPSPVERVVDEVGHAIHVGALLPGHELSLPGLAERHDVRLSVLRDVLPRLSREGLLGVYRDTAVVAPLDVDELRSIWRLRRAIQLDLFARSYELITPSELDRLDTILHAFSESVRRCPGDNAGNGMTSWGKMIIELHLGLCRPAASDIELCMLRSVLLASRRYNNLGWTVMHRDASRPGGSAIRMRQEHLDHCRELVDAFRMRNAVAVREVAGRHYDDGDLVGAESLIPAHTDSPGKPWQARRQVPLTQPGRLPRRTPGGRHLRLV